MRELVFPLGTSDEELQCIEKIAEELGMETQRGDKVVIIIIFIYFDDDCFKSEICCIQSQNYQARHAYF